MKRATLLFALFCLISVQSFAQILNQPASWPNAGWAVSGTYNVTFLLNDPTTTTNFSYNEDGAGSGTDILFAESPVIDLTAAAGGGETWIQIDYDYDFNSADQFDFEWWDADAGMWITWEALPNNSTLTSGWCAAIIAPIVTSIPLNIAGFTPTQLSGFKYRLHWESTLIWGWGFCVSSPTIYSVMPPACPDPSGLGVLSTTSSTADVNWIENGTATAWNIEYGLSGFVPTGVPTIAGTTNNPETLTGLSSATAYDFYIQSDCGGSGTSTWIGPFSFNTTFDAPVGVTCGVGFATYIFSDDMETAIGWTGDVGTAAGQWDFPTAAPGGNSTGTGPSGPQSGTTYAEFEASGSGTTIASMVTPMIDLSSGSSAAELSFYMHAFGPEIGTLNVGVGNTPTGPFTTEFSWSGQYQTAATDPWEAIGVDLTAYLGQQIYIEFSYGGTGVSFTADMSIDLVQVETCVTCPAPTNLNLISADLTSGTFDWIEVGAATEWLIEYGSLGFVPGTGTDMLTTNNPETVGGLGSNAFYDIYVQAVCGPGDTSAMVGPLTFNTYDQGLYMEADTDCGPGFNDISNLTANPIGDEQSGLLALPFPFLFQGVLYTDVTVDDNGVVQFGTANTVGFTNQNMSIAPDGLYPFWDDLDAGDVYIGISGVAPNQTLIFQWEARPHFPAVPGQEVTFQLQMIQATGEIYFFYTDTEFGGTQANFDFGLSATVGVAGPNQDVEVSYNNDQYLMDNSCAHFYYTDCPKPLNYTVVYTTNDEGAISWSAGYAGETDWTVIYGPEGFDPLTGGITVNTSTPALIMPGLDDLTTYDVYIYADCNPGVLQSAGYLGQFTTLPNCSDVTGITTSTAVDSIFTAWNWVESSGVGTYPSTGFNLQYGMPGFGLFDGSETIVNADNNFTDTTEDMTLLGGGVYEIYVQSVCSSDTSNWVGPVVFTMPITNDSICNAIDLALGTLYTFNNAGATVQAGETAIAPPTTGFQTLDGWGESNLDNTTWFTFTAPPSGNISISGIDAGLDGQIAIYDATDCANLNTFTLIGANDNAMSGGSGAPDFTACGMTPGNSYYLVHDGTFGTTGVYTILLEDNVAVEAGTSTGILEICVGESVDLYTGLSSYDLGGSWSEEIPTLGFSDPIFNSTGLATQIFNFEYEVFTGCARDTVIQQVEVFGPSSAGIDGSVDVCKNEPINLLAGLSGNVDMGGTWYDPSDFPLPSGDITGSWLPGQFNYDYIVSNGACPNDTSNVVVNVLDSCDYLNVQELYFGDMNVHPNPTSGILYINNSGSEEVYSYEITDVKGRIIETQTNVINGTETTEIDLSDVEPGIYMVKVFNDNAKKTYRIVKQ